ncbi:MAG TPA: hypothetical protein VLG11_05405 [Candidatus Saccharimonadales bacterium]|nr:hypothetical protein [Candidatus Saccharimonadales bacterium]
MKANAVASVSRLTYAMLEAATTPESQNDLGKIMFDLVPQVSAEDSMFGQFGVALPAIHIGGALVDAMLPQTNEDNSWYVSTEGDLYVNRLHPAQPLQSPEEIIALTGIQPEALTTLMPFLPNL